MKTSLANFFEPLDQLSLAAFDHSQSIILSDIWCEQPNESQASQHLLILTDTHLLYFQDHTRNHMQSLVKLNFDTRFQVLLSETNESTPTPVPIGIRLEKDSHEPINLYNHRHQVVIAWRDHLLKKISQRGFHKLFKPIKKIGKGNFASVYLVEKGEDKSLVAIKAFSKEATFSQQKGKESLINEVNILRKLNHNNLMKIYGLYESDNSIYMGVQLLEGGQLFTKIQSKHKFTSDETHKIMKGIISGLAHMHSKKIMHRDLKPENIMFRYKDDCEVVIVDFGLATWADEPEYLFVRCGTPGYVAPEIVNIKNLNTKSDPICDVFSAGLIFHILLMGKSIFPGKTYNEILAQNRACDFNLLATEYDILDKPTRDLLIRMLDKNPSTRITAEEAMKHSYFTNDMEVEDLNGIEEEISDQNSMSAHKQISLLGSLANKPTPKLSHDASIVKFIPMKKNTFNPLSIHKPEKRNKENIVNIKHIIS